MKYLLSVSALILLVACDPTVTGGTSSGGPREARLSACGADNLQTYVGQPRSALSGTAWPAGTRFIFPGMPVTLDFVAERLNFSIGPTGTITKVWCG